MADYSAKIKLIVDGLQSLKQVEDRVKNLNRLAAIDLGKAISGGKSFAAVKKEVDGVADSFSRLGKIVRGLAVGTGLGALTTSINNLSQAATALKFGGISKFAAALAAATGPAAGLFKELSGLAIQFPVVAGTATIAGAALLAFAPQVLRAGNATARLAKAAAEAGQPLSRLMASLAGTGFRVDMFIDAEQAAQLYKDRLYELSETVSVLSRRQAALQGTLNKFNSDSDTAAKIAAKLVDVTKRLNAEQEAQNDLLREAAGLRPQSVENRATNTYVVAQRRKKFLADQADAVTEAANQTRALEQAESDAARVRLAEAAKSKAEGLRDEAAAARQALTALRNLEEAESSAARSRLAQAAQARRTGVPDVVRRPIAGQAYAEPAGPGGTGVTRASAVAAEIAARKDAVVAGFQTLTYAQKEAAAAKVTLETRYNWARALAQGAEISEDLVRLSAEDAENAQLTLRAKRTEAKLQEAIARNRQKASDLDERTARKKQSRTDISSAVIGGAFPLLFGQSIGASFGGAVGGGLGARFGGQGGFAGSLVGTFAGQATIDFAINSAVQLGTALRKPTENIKELTKFLGIAGTQLDANITILQNLGMESSASAVALAKLESILKAEGYKNLDSLNKQLTDLENAFSRLKLAAANLLAEPLAGFLDWLTNVIELASKTGLPKGGSLGAVAGVVNTQSKLPTQAQKQQQTQQQQETAAEIAAQKLISQEEQRQLDLAGAQVQLEQQRLSLTRVELASKQGSIELLRISNDLEKKSVELNNAKEKSKRMQLELDIKLLKQQRAQAEAARQNAIIEAQRQVDKEILGLYNQQFSSQVELNNLYAENKSISEGQLAGLIQQGKNLDEERTKRLSILYNQREAALLGVNELKVREEIIDSYDYLARQVRDEIDNRKLINTQQQAEYNLTRLQIGQQRELNRLQAESQAQQELAQLQAGVNPQFMGLFGGSRRTGALMQSEFGMRSNLMRTQLAGLEAQMAVPGLSPDRLKTLQDEEKSLRDSLAVYLEYQPAIIQAAVAQEQFNEALGLTAPLVDSVFNGLTEVVAGTQTAQEAFANFLNSIATMLMDTVKQMISQYIALGIARAFAMGTNPSAPTGLFAPGAPGAVAGGGLSSGAGPYQFKAKGGPVSAGSPYIVGEKGPELFVPGKSGTIVPNNKLGSAGSSNVVVNVDASGSKVQGDDTKASQLGSALAAAVQAEIIKQKKPGGLLY